MFLLEQPDVKLVVLEGTRYDTSIKLTENTVRLSVGIEDIEDLKEDLEEALKQANK